jgi:predicted ATP-dependent endonuclease of OLD family
VYLTTLSLKNFRCFESLELDNLQKLAIFIGENDAGKTVLLDAIDLLISNSNCSAQDCRRQSDGSQAEKVILQGRFRLEDTDEVPEHFLSGANKDQVILTKVFTEGGTKTFVQGLGYDNSKFDDNEFIGADNQKALLREFGLVPASNEAGRKAQRNELVTKGVLKHIEKDVQLQSFNIISQYLPRIERVAASDYKSAESMIQNTLRSVAASVLDPAEPDEEMIQLLEALAKIKKRIRSRLNEDIKKFKKALFRNHQKLKNVSVSPTIDFTKSVTTTTLRLDLGDGERPLDQFGDGTKRRMWMGLLEWERETAQSNKSESIIRLYDEPDVNLHYEAQKQLFNNINEIVNDDSLKSQCFICTHSVSMVNRAPSTSIRLIQIGKDNNRQIKRIESSDGDDDVIQFFHEIGRNIGLTNTAILYERGFLIVEGETEDSAIPVLYRTLYGRSMTEDGLVIINLHTCSAWKAVTKLLLKNRLEMTHFLLDNDCKEEDSSGYISENDLKEFGCDESFLKNQVTYVGRKEFEDSFPVEAVVSALNDKFPREDGNLWLETEIQILIEDCDKFSKELLNLVRRYCVRNLRSGATKPTIATAVAKECSIENVPAAIKEALDSLRLRVGLTDE